MGTKLDSDCMGTYHCVIASFLLLLFYCIWEENTKSWPRLDKVM